MESQRKQNKRPNAGVENQRPTKKLLTETYKFQVLLPNGTSLMLEISDPENEMPIEEFLRRVTQEYKLALRKNESLRGKRKIKWDAADLHFVDASEKKIKTGINFKDFLPNKWYILRLNDGEKEADIYENMWDLTPDTELLKELPEEYNFECALADLIDNSLQAVWSNSVNERRLISVNVTEERITIFDTGPGMDGSDEKSIVKWGRMGASLHRSSKGKGVGGKPPYLVPYFGMFGYGGPIASMHLGRCAVVSSKTKDSKKVYTLHLERDVLLSRSGSEQTWKTNGGLRDPLEDELERSAHGSFTKVDILGPKMRSVDIFHLQCTLKDIYFPYIQCDEVSSEGRTTTPIEFQVNGVDLAEIEGGEVATTNLHSCNGPEFVFQLHFSFNQDVSATSSGERADQKANARLKCVYFPIVEGKESIERIMEKLNAEGCGIAENYESFSHVSIRRLGRLLPDARRSWLPFMDLRQKRGERLKRICLRVKCFIETDAGFNPTASKTDLAHHHPFTTALKNFGRNPLEKDNEVHVNIYKNGKPLTLSQLEKQYQDWILKMHESYDKEIGGGEDDPLLIVGSSNMKGLDLSWDVIRVHKVIERKGTSWRSGLKIKILRGACAGCHKTNIYATLEYILVQGFQGDARGEARLICRPIKVPDEMGCLLTESGENASIDIRGSISLPISVIDSGKCHAIESTEWDIQLEKQRQKAPSSIDLLSSRHRQELKFEGALPVGNIIDAGYDPPKEIVAVVRPISYNLASASKNLDPKYIVKDNYEMSLVIKFVADLKKQDAEHIYTRRVAPSSCRGFHGLYIFPLRCQLPQLFKKAGIYIFSFSIKELRKMNIIKKVKVKALSEVKRWGLLEDQRLQQCSVRVGTCFPHFSIACYDRYDNRTSFTHIPELLVKVCYKGVILARVLSVEVHISSDKQTLMVKDALIESNELDKIRPSYEAVLVSCSQDKLYSVTIPFQVIPGCLHHVIAQPPTFEKRLIPGQVITELKFEMFDTFNNHVKEGEEIMLKVDGFAFQHRTESLHKVDEHGCVDLSGLLKVAAGYGRTVSLCVLHGDKTVFEQQFETEKRELRAATELPQFCFAGSQLEELVFEIINAEGDVDESINDDEKHFQSHSLVIKSNSFNTSDSLVKYSFHLGRCTVRAIPLPEKEGIFCFCASHSRHPELRLSFEVQVERNPSNLKTPKVEHQCIDRQIVPHQDSSFSDEAKDLVVSVMSDRKVKKLQVEVFEYAQCIGKHEDNLRILEAQKAAMEEKMSELQASIALYKDLGNLPDQEVMKQIESKDTAASVVCELRRISHHDLADLILGIVVFLGRVQTNELSRILAEYLGEDYMLAVVCKSYDDVKFLEKYDQNGHVDRNSFIHTRANGFQKFINGHYLVICLENIRPYSGELSADPQRKLALRGPTLPDGKTPTGFLGYAVNMIYPEVNHLHTRTANGHGLRETLFYRLFGELQVYQTRECMMKAVQCINEGAVSLDGGILKGNGVLSLGYREPDICFPVLPESHMQISPQTGDVLKQIEAKREELRRKIYEIRTEEKNHRKTMRKYQKKKAKYCKILEELEGLEHNSNMDDVYISPCSSKPPCDQPVNYPKNARDCTHETLFA